MPAIKVAVWVPARSDANGIGLALLPVLSRVDSCRRACGEKAGRLPVISTTK